MKCPLRAPAPAPARNPYSEAPHRSRPAAHGVELHDARSPCAAPLAHALGPQQPSTDRPRWRAQVRPRARAQRDGVGWALMHFRVAPAVVLRGVVTLVRGRACPCGTQNPLFARTCRFESGRGHHVSLARGSGGRGGHFSRVSEAQPASIDLALQMRGRDELKQRPDVTTQGFWQGVQSFVKEKCPIGYHRTPPFVVRAGCTTQRAVGSPRRPFQ
jgi:hypothetical protein